MRLERVPYLSERRHGVETVLRALDEPRDAIVLRVAGCLTSLDHHGIVDDNQKRREVARINRAS